MPNCRYSSPKRRIPSAPSEEEILGCSEPPPPYSTICPDGGVHPPEDRYRHCRFKSEERRRGNCRIIHTKVLECDGERRVYMDEVSYIKHERNNRNLRNCTSPQALDDIDFYPTQQVHCSNSSSNHHLHCPIRKENGVTYAMPISRHSRHNSGKIKDDFDVEYAMIPPLSNSEAYDVIQKFMKKRSLLKGNKYKNYDVLETHTSPVWHYHIITILESRQLTDEKKPCQGRRSTSSKPQHFSSEWEVPIDMPIDGKSRTVVVPGTSAEVECDRCCGKGTKECGDCRGSGQVDCYSCHALGHTITNETIVHSYSTDSSIQPTTEVVSRQVQCHHCGGMGRNICHSCSGSCAKRCRGCSGSGKMLIFQQVTAKWTTKSSYHLSESNVPDEYLTKGGGLHVFNDTRSNCPLDPIHSSDCLNKEIQAASEIQVAKHRVIRYDEMLREQSHFVQLVPVYKVTMGKPEKKTQFSRTQLYKKQKVFYIVGTNKLVYNPNGKGCKKS